MFIKREREFYIIKQNLFPTDVSDVSLLAIATVKFQRLKKQELLLPSIDLHEWQKFTTIHFPSSINHDTDSFI
jgi:hypothetical protein